MREETCLNTNLHRRACLWLTAELPLPCIAPSVPGTTTGQTATTLTKQISSSTKLSETEARASRHGVQDDSRLNPVTATETNEASFVTFTVSKRKLRK